MRSPTARLSVGAGGLVVLWIAAFWWMDPDPSIRFDERDTAARGDSALTVSSASGRMDTPPGAAANNDAAPSTIDSPKTAAQDEAVAAPKPIAAKPKPARIRMRLYTIREGDLLSRIAQREYGSIRYTDFLFEHNKERLGLTSPDAIREGQVLEIPPLDESQGGGDA
jgi:nucleoid-associated protein YgaU